MKSITLEAGISGYHKMIKTIFRSTFAKGKPKTFQYHCYKMFNLEQFQTGLKGKLDEISNNSIDIFLEELKACLDKDQIQLKRKFINNKSEENSKKYKQQRNYCMNFYIKRRWNIFKPWTLVRSMITKCFEKL